MRKFLLVTTFTLIFPTFAHAFSGYNDPAFTFNAQDSDKQWGLPAAGFVDAMDYGSGNPSVVVAIIDTGLDATHEDLAGSHIVPGYDFIHKKPLTGKEDSDDNGHGTLVAGIIAATAGNGKGVAGAAPGLSIMPLKALGSDASATSDVVAEAISYAVSHRADVINLSLGSVSVSSDPLLSSAIEKAYRAGVIIVAAAGNDYQSTGINLDDHPAYPICDDNGENMVIGVTAVDKAMQKPDFANYGQRCIDVAAPGKRILSTINHDPLTKEYKASTYAYVSGTSIASPFVSALAGLIKSRYSYATNVQIREQILRTVRNIDL
ncbi:MAG TPA: S8 family serine peptidase, partial [Patescibacteria group bacterium]|nr:S8 family serine peptidase [Patescibacteria group bacterium]